MDNAISHILLKFHYIQTANATHHLDLHEE
jgi:hypothetical protein